jgi:mono/diheme cytochrome c family protein
MNRLVGSIVAVVALGACVSQSLDLPPPDTPPPVVPPVTARWAPPFSGGHLIVTRDGGLAIAADPDHDRVLVVDLVTRELRTAHALVKGDEPGRVIEDGAGRVHVALRRGGAVVTLSPGATSIVDRRAVCPEPRGLAWQASGDLVHVTCAGGELVTLPAAGGEAVRRLRLDRDLRDVVVVGDTLMVTRFKSAEVLTVDATGAVIERVQSPSVQRRSVGVTGDLVEVPTEASVAWRAVPMPDGSGIVVAHQRALRGLLSTTPSGYAGDMCGGGPTESTATLFAPGHTPAPGRALGFAALPVDVAVSPNAERVAFAMAGDRTVRVVGASFLTSSGLPPCEEPPEQEEAFADGQGTPTSVAFTPAGDLVVFFADSLAITVYPLGPSIDYPWTAWLPGGAIRNEGRDLFHMITSAGIACASCHPEGREDGLVWEFRDLGPRRSQHVGGHLLARAPYHWDADMTDLGTLMNEVFVGRMGGFPLSEWQVQALGAWLDAIPAPLPRADLDPAAVERGRALFLSSEVGCAACHAGPLYTSNMKADVGTGGLFKIPSLLGIGARAPFLHDGCAETLRDRFVCGGGDSHGYTSDLTSAQLDDLVVFLESL